MILNPKNKFLKSLRLIPFHLNLSPTFFSDLVPDIVCRKNAAAFIPICF